MASAHCANDCSEQELRKQWHSFCFNILHLCLERMVTHRYENRNYLKVAKDQKNFLSPKNVPNHCSECYSPEKNISAQNSDLPHCFGDGAKVKNLFEIEEPLSMNRIATFLF